jgi:transposase
MIRLVSHIWFVSTIDIMDIMDRPVISTSDTKHYRWHSTEFKLALVKQTMQPGASVARIAGWRKLYRDGLLDALPDASAAMLPVTIIAPDARNSDSSRSSPPKTRTASVIRLECAKGCLIIEGVPDSGILDRVLDRLLR